MSVANPSLDEFRLTSLANCGGCAAKVDPSLVQMLTSLVPPTIDPAVLVGLNPNDDAAVYQLDKNTALVASVDFFPPLVDEPTDYGAIAAANALSDLYAMGANPIFGLTLSGFPRDVDPEIISRVNAGAAGKMTECGASILGGHSIRCAEPVFGLSVVGLAHPEKVWCKSGARVGDKLVLSKPIGTGVLLSQGNVIGVRDAVAHMTQTNGAAAEKLGQFQPGAVTDVTGYGLAGHAWEVAQRSKVGLVIQGDAVPLLPGALEAARGGAGTSADDWAAENSRICFPEGFAPVLKQLMSDPQTSGGLLATVQDHHLSQLESSGFVVIGEVVPGEGEVSFV